MAFPMHLFLIPPAILGLTAAVAEPPASEPAVAPWTIKVLAKDASPLAGATVKLLGIKGQPVHASEQTDASGKAVLQPPAAGSYLIRVEKEGFKPQELGYLASPRGTEPPPIEFRLVRGS